MVLAESDQLLTGMVEKGEPAGDHDQIAQSGPDRRRQGLDRLRAHADRPDQAGRLGLGERGHPGGDTARRVVLVRVVQVGDVDPVEAEPFPTVAQRTKDSGDGGIPHTLVGGGHHEACVVESVRTLGSGSQHPADLGGQQEIPPGPVSQRGPEPAFGQSQSVVRCGVEVAHPAVPGRVHDVPSPGVGDLLEQVAEAGRPEGESLN